MKISYIIILFIYASLAYSQTNIHNYGCGTDHGLTQESYEELLLQYQEDIQQNIYTNRDIQFVRVQFHIVRSDNGSGGLDEAALWPVLEDMNEDFFPSGLQFYHPEVVNEIWDSQYVICENDTELNTLRSIYNTPNVLDIFIVSSATSGDTELCGISTFTFMSPSYQGIVITTSCWNNETGSHEIGHYFDLFHTHDPQPEYVDGQSCNSRGDGLCDTPADPDLSISGNVSSSCVYTGNSTDGHGDLYDGEECMDYPPCALYGGPDTKNIMSYNLYDSCVDHFTNDQHEKAIYIANAYRSSYLVDPTYPFFQFTEVSYEEIDGDLDQVINPGESVDLFFNLELPEYWPVGAGFVDVVITTEETYVQIANEEISFQNIDPGESIVNSDNPVTISFDSDIPLGKYEFQMIVITEHPQEFSFTLNVSLNQYGFPVYEASQKTSPLAVDFDNNGDDEIIFGDYNGFLHILRSDGSEIVDENFPFYTGDQVWGAVSAADMDNDGLMDIAVVSKSKHCYLLDINGLKVDYNADSWLLGTPAIGNIDDDIDLEVVFGGYSSSMKKIFAINADGSDVVGYPLDIGERVKIGVALADFNGNGKDDIVVGTDSDYIHLFYDDGSEAPGFPVAVGDKVQSAPSILDVDGQKVIFAGCNDDNLYAVNADGSIRFIVSTTNNVLNSPAFLEYNNSFYVFFSDDSGFLYAIDMDGNALDGWPVDAEAAISGSVVFSDLDNDGEGEVVAVTELTDVLAYNLDGSFHDDFPLNDEFTFTSSPMIMDMDDDGDLEILAGSVNSLVAIDIKSAGNSNGYWSIFRGGVHRTGYYNMTDSECGVELGDVTGDGTINILDLVQVSNYILNVSVPAYACAADFTEDGNVNILDLVQIANFILDN